jgi:hypothetical protein
MRNRLLATTAAMLVGMTLAAAQNMPNGAQSERGSAGAERQQQGRDAQRGAREQSKADDKRGQSQRSEGREPRDHTTGQSSGSKEQSQHDQGMQGRSKQSDSKQSDSKQRGEAQRDLTTGQSQREQTQNPAKSQRGQGDQTQGKASQSQQPRPETQRSQSQHGQSPAEQQKAQPNQANQAQPNQSQQGNQAQPNQSQQGQAQPSQAQQGQGIGNVTLTSEQRTRIQQTVLAGRNVPRVDNVTFALNVGVAVPATVRIVDVPPTLIEIYPQWRGHQYFVVRDEIVIVDRSRKIVATVPVGSSGGAAQLGGAGGGARLGTGMNLSVDEIRQVQIALREKGFYRGEPDGVLGRGTTQALISFQRQQGFQANGRIDTQTVTALGVSNVSGQQGNQNGSPALTTGQGGNATQQQPGNQNMGAGNPSESQSSTGQSGKSPQQEPANQNAKSRTQDNQNGSQPSTTGQGGERSQQPAAGRDQRRDTSNPAANPNSRQGNANDEKK